MIVRKKDRVIVLGITGKQGTFWTEKMIAYGTNVVGGVNPKRAGETHVGVPIFASTAEARPRSAPTSPSCSSRRRWPRTPGWRRPRPASSCWWC